MDVPCNSARAIGGRVSSLSAAPFVERRQKLLDGLFLGPEVAV